MNEIEIELIVIEPVELVLEVVNPIASTPVIEPALAAAVGELLFDTDFDLIYQISKL
jgi:hypothetical protein